jgi:predicted transglutaminase-like cysteine proteinase
VQAAVQEDIAMPAPDPGPGALSRRSFVAGLGATMVFAASSRPLLANSGRKLIPIVGEVRSPVGYRSLLRRQSELTRIDAREAPDDVRLVSALEDVNRAVNASIEYNPEIGYDAWVTVRRGFGDCDDYALTKKRELMRRGIPNLRFVLCRTASGELHLVLSATTQTASYILDNKRDAVLTADRLPYTWLAWETGEANWQRIAVA